MDITVSPSKAHQRAATQRKLPLAVDLDGSLVRTDTFYEGICELARRKPAGIINAMRSFWGGKAAIKRSVSDAVTLDVAAMPYNEEVLDYLRACKAGGRRVGLFTAADQSIADAVAAHLQLFDMAHGSDGRKNLSGARKAEIIERVFGPRFAYLGDHETDLPIFARAEVAALAGPVERLRRKLPADKPIEASFTVRSAGWREWARALRVKHWSKNLLIFVPVILSAAPSPAILARSVLLFLLFCTLASATYVLNDLLDLPADRAHPEKRHRPLAFGSIHLRDGMLASATLLSGTLLAALLWLPPAASLVLGGYFVVTLAYSFYVKRRPVADVLCLAGLFTSRILAGSLLLPSAPSPWLLSFSIVLFLSLAQVKRYAELRRVVSEGANGILSRGYSFEDLPLLLSTGVGSAIGSAVIFAIYLIQEQYPRQIYQHPQWLWAMMPVLLGWLLRIWRLTVHGQMDEDPVLFALHDRVSLTLAAAIGLILVAAWI